MRVRTKALAPLSSLLLLVSCAATSSPAPGIRGVAPSARVAAPPPPATAAVPVAYTTNQQGNYDRPVPPHQAGNYSPPKTGRITILGARRELDDAFAPAEDPGVFGIEFSNIPWHGGVGFELGFQFAFDEAENQNVPTIGNADLRTSQGELYAGLRAELTQGPVRPYVGFGGTWIRTETTVDTGSMSASEDDSDLGFYAHAGIQADLTDSFFVGVDYRRLFDTEYTVDGTDFDGDYEQIAFILGFSF